MALSNDSLTLHKRSKNRSKARIIKRAALRYLPYLLIGIAEPNKNTDTPIHIGVSAKKHIKNKTYKTWTILNILTYIK